MRYIFTIAFFACACGELPDYRCDYYVDSICVSSEYDINYNYLYRGLKRLEEEVDYFVIPFSLSDITGHTMLIFVEGAEWDEELKGKTIENKSFVKYNYGNDFAACMKNYYVALHEIMHQIAEYNLHISTEDNIDHNFSGFFMESLGDLSIESSLYRYMWFDVCGARGNIEVEY